MRDETTPEQIVFAFSVDYDGCISPAEFSDKNVEQNIHTANLIRHFLDAVKNKIKDMKIFIAILIILAVFGAVWFYFIQPNLIIGIPLGEIPPRGIPIIRFG